MTGEGRGSRLVVAAAVLGAGLVLGAVVFGVFFYQARTRSETIQVVGSASERFTSDVAKWRVTLARQVPDGGLADGYQRIREDLDRFLERLTAAGIDRAAVSVQPVNAQPQWGPNGREGYNLVQGLYVVSEDPDRLEELALNPGPLLEGGVALEASQLEYYYSRIADLKHALLSRATEDARARATEIASGSQNGSLGRMVSARAGVFQITEPYSTDVAAYGIHSTATREKEISVTVHATFRAE
jgi:uncharacterized protein